MVEELYARKRSTTPSAPTPGDARETLEQHVYTALNTGTACACSSPSTFPRGSTASARHAAADNDVATLGASCAPRWTRSFGGAPRAIHLSAIRVLPLPSSDAARPSPPLAGATPAKHTTLELLRVYLPGKHRLKRDAEISELLNKRVEGVDTLEEEWVDIVKYMYAPEDATLLLVRRREIARVHHRDGGPRRSAAAAPPEREGAAAASARRAGAEDLSRREAAAAAAPAAVRAHAVQFVRQSAARLPAGGPCSSSRPSSASSGRWLRRRRTLRRHRRGGHSPVGPRARPGEACPPRSTGCSRRSRPPRNHHRAIRRQLL